MHFNMLPTVGSVYLHLLMNPNDKHTNFSCTKPMTYSYLDNFHETDFIKKQTAFFYKQPGWLMVKTSLKMHKKRHSMPRKLNTTFLTIK